VNFTFLLFSTFSWPWQHGLPLPFGRPPSADEVAAVAIFLASDAAAQVTGQTISVNGGLPFGGW
jgi:NAD(P)-dependent dehydrogenase (short-subunit alcohol dehydrogenase family)